MFFVKKEDNIGSVSNLAGQNGVNGYNGIGSNGITNNTHNGIPHTASSHNFQMNTLATLSSTNQSPTNLTLSPSQLLLNFKQSPQSESVSII